jgi:hypothetical protein
LLLPEQTLAKIKYFSQNSIKTKIAQKGSRFLKLLTYYYVAYVMDGKDLDAVSTGSWALAPIERVLKVLFCCSGQGGPFAILENMLHFATPSSPSMLWLPVETAATPLPQGCSCHFNGRLSPYHYLNPLDDY